MSLGQANVPILRRERACRSLRYKGRSVHWENLSLPMRRRWRKKLRRDALLGRPQALSDAVDQNLTPVLGAKVAGT